MNYNSSQISPLVTNAKRMNLNNSLLKGEPSPARIWCIILHHQRNPLWGFQTDSSPKTACVGTHIQCGYISGIKNMLGIIFYALCLRKHLKVELL